MQAQGRSGEHGCIYIETQQENQELTQKIQAKENMQQTQVQ